MKKIYLIVIAFFTTYCSFAQTVEILRKTDSQSLRYTGKDFAFIESAADTSQLEFIATIKATDKARKSTIQNLYFDILQKAQKKGANAFRLNSFVINDSTNEETLVLDTYFGTSAVLAQNFASHEKNVLIVFGGEKPSSTSTYSFKVGDQEKIIKSGTFYKQSIQEGQELRINKGGFTGMTMWVKWAVDKPATFLTLSSFGINDAAVPMGTVGISFNTGRLNRIDPNLGFLLMQLLKQSK